MPGWSSVTLNRNLEFITTGRTFYFFLFLLLTGADAGTQRKRQRSGQEQSDRFCHPFHLLSVNNSIGASQRAMTATHSATAERSGCPREGTRLKKPAGSGQITFKMPFCQELSNLLSQKNERPHNRQRILTFSGYFSPFPLIFHKLLTPFRKKMYKNVENCFSLTK